MLDRTSLDDFVAQLLAAAEARDFAVLAAAMSDDFSSSMIDDEPTRDELVAQWRSDPARVERLAVLLRGECAFVDTQAHWLCPRAVAEVRGEYGDAERVHFANTPDGWQWVAFIEEDPPSAKATTRKQAPSRDPIVASE